MSDKFSELGRSISLSLNKVSRIFLQCSNPVSQQDMDAGNFFPEDWAAPFIVAADGTILSYYSRVHDRWFTTEARASWIDQSATPSANLRELRGDLLFFLNVVG